MAFEEETGISREDGGDSIFYALKRASRGKRGNNQGKVGSDKMGKVLEA